MFFLFEYTFFMCVDFSFLISLLLFGWTGKEDPKATPFSWLSHVELPFHICILFQDRFICFFSHQITKTKRQIVSTLVWYLYYFLMKLQKHAIGRTVVQKWSEMKLLARTVRDLRKLKYRLMLCFQLEEYDEWWELFSSLGVTLNIRL